MKPQISKKSSSRITELAGLSWKICINKHSWFSILAALTNQWKAYALYRYCNWSVSLRSFTIQTLQLHILMTSAYRMQYVLLHTSPSINGILILLKILKPHMNLYIYVCNCHPKFPAILGPKLVIKNKAYFQKTKRAKKENKDERKENWPPRLIRESFCIPCLRPILYAGKKL